MTVKRYLIKCLSDMLLCLIFLGYSLSIQNGYWIWPLNDYWVEAGTFLYTTAMLLLGYYYTLKVTFAPESLGRYIPNRVMDTLSKFCMLAILFHFEFYVNFVVCLYTFILEGYIFYIHRANRK